MLGTCDTVPFYPICLCHWMRPSRFLGGDGTEEMALYRLSGHLYTVAFESNLGDLVVRVSTP